MLDLETLGIRCGSVILSIGACVMGRGFGADRGDAFHSFLKPKPQLAVGCTMDPSTVLWWLAQSEEARQRMIAGQLGAVQPMESLLALSEWMDRAAPDPKTRKVWSNGADFDLALLNDLYRRFGLEAPWPYNGARDMRTILDIARCKAGDLLAPPAGAHDALQDAYYQSDVVALAFKRIFIQEA
jgi:hypothetical protein